MQQTRLGICSLCRQEGLLTLNLCPTCAAVIDTQDVPDPDEGDMRANQRRGLGRGGVPVTLVEFTRCNDLQAKRAASRRESANREKRKAARRHYERTKGG